MVEPLEMHQVMERPSQSKYRAVPAFLLIQASYKFHVCSNHEAEVRFIVEEFLFESIANNATKPSFWSPTLIILLHKSWLSETSFSLHAATYMQTNEQQYRIINEEV